MQSSRVSQAGERRVTSGQNQPHVSGWSRPSPQMDGLALGSLRRRSDNTEELVLWLLPRPTEHTASTASPFPGVSAHFLSARALGLPSRVRTGRQEAVDFILGHFCCVIRLRCWCIRSGRIGYFQVWKLRVLDKDKVKLSEPKNTQISICS